MFCFILRAYSIGTGYERLAGTCKRDNEPSGSIKCGELLE